MMKLTKMAKITLSSTLWLGRGTATVMGLAMLPALTVGLASTALAGTGVGARFDLGKTNAVNQISKLVGSVARPSLQIDNNSTASGSTALDLQVEKGKPPLKVNSTTNVAGLNADTLDGNDSKYFLTSQDIANDSRALGGVDAEAYFSKFAGTYVVDNGEMGSGDETQEIRSAACDEGDKVLGGGGGGGLDFQDNLMFSIPSLNSGPNQTDRWIVEVRDNGDAAFLAASALCADFPPLR